jgi:hypothetical protein
VFIGSHTASLRTAPASVAHVLSSVRAGIAGESEKNRDVNPSHKGSWNISDNKVRCHEWCSDKVKYGVIDSGASMNLIFQAQVPRLTTLDHCALPQ